MAALRILARGGGLATFPNPAWTSCHVAPLIAQIQQRWGSYKSSPKYTKYKNYTDYEITKDPNEWKYVERLLRYKTVPKPPTGDVELPSGYKPARASPTDYSYFIERTRNYLQPVYLKLGYRGLKRITEIKKIQGDIWAMDRDIKEYITKCTGRAPPSQIHEFVGMIKFKGDYVNRVKDWMNTKGF
ncbi:putative 39s ribosomal protein mitochondrial-like protein [Lasius niger]|uniref:Large ribosomal subunit protein mL49 n=1 Tax=Lasius niger TaxID=67767 RepID=A0A0J7KXJ6_LASNI|nr:putative 39s ribosomal protein mitochondrial-like protein [Lasius niger]